MDDRLSDLDVRLIALLQRDASLSAADLARLAGSSAATCWRRIRDLEARGILGRHVRLVDPAALGRKLDAFCHVRMRAHSADARADFERAMAAEPTVVEVYALSGDWDYLLHVLVRDVSDLEAILMRRVLEHRNVAATSTQFALRRVKHVTEVPV